MTSTWIKICGITSKADAEAAIAAGVSAIGLVFAPSPRQVSFEGAVEIATVARGQVEVVGVFKDLGAIDAAHEALRFDRIQFHGEGRLRAPVPVLRAVRPETFLEMSLHQENQDDNDDENDDAHKDDQSEMTLIDGSEGRGVVFDWTRLRKRRGRYVIAGGLSAENVGDAIDRARPFGVDVSSGVESAPGRKDAFKMIRFVAAVRRADAR